MEMSVNVHAQSAVDESAVADGVALQGLLEELSQLSGQLARARGPAEVAACSLRQADVLKQLVAVSKPEDREAWLKQMADCLQLAVSNGPAADRTAFERLRGLEQHIAEIMPGSALAAYVTYREMQADYAAKIGAPGADPTLIQQEWRGRLSAFVAAYPQAEDTPAAIQELASVDECLGRKAEARACYERLAQSFSGREAGAQAAGAIRWMDLEGRTMHLGLPLLYSENERQDVPFDIDELHGKVVIVYFWASTEARAAQDFNDLARLMAHYKSKGLELVCVNMDNSPAEAKQFLGSAQIPGVHVFQRGGLHGTVASRYGLTMLPKVLLVGRDGRVISEPMGVSELEEHLRN